jgi:hypothetical protein
MIDLKHLKQLNHQQKTINQCNTQQQQKYIASNNINKKKAINQCRNNYKDKTAIKNNENKLQQSTSLILQTATLA